MLNHKTHQDNSNPCCQ